MTSAYNSKDKIEDLLKHKLQLFLVTLINGMEIAFLCRTYIFFVNKLLWGSHCQLEKSSLLVNDDEYVEDI